MSKAFLESVNATETLYSKILFEEFVTGLSLPHQKITTEKEDILRKLYDKIRSKFPNLDRSPFLLLSSQNCSEMIVGIGNLENLDKISCTMMVL